MPLSDSSDQLNLVAFEKDLPREQDRYFAGRLISQVQTELYAKKRRLASILSRWTIAYDYLKERHFDILTNKPLQSEIKHFHSTVSILRGLGDLLLAQLENHDEINIEELFGLTSDDIAACIEELGDIERAYRSEMTSATQEDILNTVFSD